MANTTTITGNLVREPRASLHRLRPAGCHLRRCRQSPLAGPQHRRVERDHHLPRHRGLGSLGEHAAASLHKGDRVTVTGRLDQRSWGNGDGERRTKLELVATDVAASLRFAASLLR